MFRGALQTISFGGNIYWYGNCNKAPQFPTPDHGLSRSCFICSFTIKKDIRDLGYNLSADQRESQI